MRPLVVIFLVPVLCCAGLLSCRSSRGGLASDRKLLALVYQDQRHFCDTVQPDGSDFRLLLPFASRGRYRLYQSIGVSFAAPGTYIMLEEMHPVTGRYVGILLFKEQLFVYLHDGDPGMRAYHFTTHDIDSVGQLTRIRRDVYERVATWDLAFFYDLKHSIGRLYNDGATFMASRIVQPVGGGKPRVETLGFFEYWQ